MSMSAAQRLYDAQADLSDDAQRLLITVLDGWEKERMPSNIAMGVLLMAAISVARGTGMTRDAFIEQAASVWNALDKCGAP